MSLPARMVTSARRCDLRLPENWPWASDFTDILDALRALSRLTG